MSILINNETEYDLTNYYSAAESAARETLRLGNRSAETEVSITFVSNEEIRALNKRYRGMDKATDVLSFSAEGALSNNTEVLGDIIISFDQALCQARQYGNTGKREIAFLVAHGILHLLGYDHNEAEGEAAMISKQKEVMKILDKI